MSYNLAEHLTVQQKQAIIRIIANQEKKKSQKNHPDIYQNHIGEPEFWNGLAKNIADSLFKSNINCYDSYKIESRGNLDGKGYRIELLDGKNKEKFFIDYTGDIGQVEEYTPPKGLGLSGFEKFILIMIPVYLILFIFFIAISGYGVSYDIPTYIVVGLGMVNLIIAYFILF